MTTRKRTTPPEPPWQVILEDIRSQNRATLEAVQSSHASLQGQIAEVDERLGARITLVEGAVRQNSADIRGLKTEVLELKTDVRVLKADVAELKVDVAELKTDVAELKTDVAELKTDVAELKTDVAELKTDVAGLKTDVAGLKTDLRRVEGKVDELSPLEARVTALERRR